MKEETIARIRKFSEDRDWEQFHTPENLAKSIVIEAGELLECFQWSGTKFDREHVKEELADVMVYCRNMLDALDLDEDEMAHFMRCESFACPFFRNGDEYLVVRKQM